MGATKIVAMELKSCGKFWRKIGEILSLAGCVFLTIISVRVASCTMKGDRQIENRVTLPYTTPISVSED
jgi:hypothetical protein